MPKGQIVRPPWKGLYCGINELARWAGVSRTTIVNATKRPGGPVPIDYPDMGMLFEFPDAVEALKSLGYTEHGGGLKSGPHRKPLIPIPQEAVHVE
jgi:hypothetical protein